MSGHLRRVDVTAGAYGITTGPDDALWLTLAHSGQIMRLSLDGDRRVFTVGTANSRPAILTAGSDGAVWFTATGADLIGRIDRDGALSTVALDPGSGPFGICTGTDGAVWFAEMNANRVGRLGTGGGRIGVDSYLEIPIAEAFPSFVTAAPDGSVWVTLNRANALARIGVDGEVDCFPVPTPHAGPVGISCGPGGAVWFAELGAGQIGRFDDGVIREYALPDRAARPHAVAADPVRGGCWFTEWAANRLGHLTVDGTLREFDLPASVAEPHGITIGPDGAVWTALESGAVIRLETAGLESSQDPVLPRNAPADGAP